MEKLTGNGKTGPILKGENQTIMNLVLEKGKEIPKHDAPDTVVVVPVKGEIIFKGDQFEEHVTPGSVVVVQPNEPHSLEAVEDAEVMVIKSKLV